MKRCNYVSTVPLPALIPGWQSARCSRCSNETLPGMLFCEDHATRDAMAMHIRDLWKAAQR